MLGLPRMEEEKASLLPSADQAGERFVPPNVGKATGRPSSREYMPSCTPRLLTVENATRAPSGDRRGERVMDAKRVSCCWPEPSSSVCQSSLWLLRELTKVILL